MDYQVFYISIFLLSVVWCDETVGNAEAVGLSNKVPEKITPELPSLCSKCNCTDSIVNCDHKKLTSLLNDYHWPDKSISVMSFEGNLLVHLKAFPKIVIEKLVLRKNEITHIDLCAFKQLINLTELDLSHNQLTSEQLLPNVFEGRFSPEAYEPLAKLEILNLASNNLHMLHQDLFEHMTSLKVLNLAGNLFTAFDLSTSIAISSLPYLEELDISHCDLETLQVNQFHALKYLKKLNLTGNRFTYLPASLGDANSLEYLNLDENPIQSIADSNIFPNILKLRELSLCFMPFLARIGNGSLSGLTALENLRIKNCSKLEEIDENALVKQINEVAVWPPLKKLDLSNNALRYLPALLVGRWDRLEKLDLINNKWRCDCNNQYLVGTLLPKYGQKLMTNEELYKLTCATPLEHEGKNLTSLSHRKLRCLDLYGARPEKDAAILVGVLIILLLAIPVCLTIFVFWRRGFFFCGSHGPASFSRAYYKRASNDDDL